MNYMKNDLITDKLIIIMWFLILLLNIIIIKNIINRKLDKIENQNKEIIEYIKHEDVEE